MPWPPETPEQWEAEARVKGAAKTLAPERQVGGNHYNVMKIQPSRFWMANDYDGDAGMILKYLARHKLKKGREDVEKALSFVYIRLDNKEFISRPRRDLISMHDFIIANALDDTTAGALYILDFWVKSGYGECTFHLHLIEAIAHILAEQYPV